MQCKRSAITIEYVNVQIQRGSNDCGLFALAFVTSLCNREVPSIQWYDQKAMWMDFTQCIKLEEMKPFPTIETWIRKLKPSSFEELKVYCVCRLPYNGLKMIEWSGFAEWFHTDCITIPHKKLQDVPLDWFCAECAIWTVSLATVLCWFILWIWLIWFICSLSCCQKITSQKCITYSILSNCRLAEEPITQQYSKTRT